MCAALACLLEPSWWWIVKATKAPAHEKMVQAVVGRLHGAGGHHRRDEPVHVPGFNNTLCASALR
jgi:hypothetical protein